MSEAQAKDTTATPWEPVIGLEVHVQLLTASKIFCSCATAFGAPPNSQTCPICLGHPGVLPVLNRRAVELALRMAVATESRIATASVFARKNYFYPDLPKGYQISQFDRPLAEEGFLTLPGGRRVGLVRIHLEEDAGKLLHEGPGADRCALVDFNRSGVPLIEVVGKPELRSAAEARHYLVALHTLVTYLGICDGNMEEGSLRCDANVSVRRRGQPLGTRTEIKNLNSFRNVERALDHEIVRQVAELERGGAIVQETRGFDADRGVTFSMRGKEEAHDYRYFPEPDLVPLEVDAAWREAIQRGLPELPVARQARFVASLGLSEDDAGLVAGSRALADYFEEVAAASGNAKAAANWVLREVMRELKERPIAGFPVTPPRLAEMIGMIDRGEISSTAARDVFAGMMEGREPADVVRDKGLGQVSDAPALEAAVSRVLAANPQAVESYRAGKERSFGFLVGAVMKETKGRGNPKLVNELVKKLLGT